MNPLKVTFSSILQWTTGPIQHFIYAWYVIIVVVITVVVVVVVIINNNHNLYLYSKNLNQQIKLQNKKRYNRC